MWRGIGGNVLHFVDDYHVKIRYVSRLGLVASNAFASLLALVRLRPSSQQNVFASDTVLKVAKFLKHSRLPRFPSVC